MALTTQDYLRQQQALLPQGVIWSREDDSSLTGLLTAFAAAFSAVDSRAWQLLAEADPRQTAELLADWERVAGLPDGCSVGATQSIAQRRIALISKLVRLGGQSQGYFISLAAALGYTITITEFRPFRAGQSHAGDAVATNWEFAWQTNGALNSITPFRAGQSGAGDPLNSWGNAILECIINRVKPAHTAVIFTYT